MRLGANAWWWLGALLLVLSQAPASAQAQSAPDQGARLSAPRPAHAMPPPAPSHTVSPQLQLRQAHTRVDRAPRTGGGPMWELAGPGIGLLAGSYASNAAYSLALGFTASMFGGNTDGYALWGLAPIVGPWVQSTRDRWIDRGMRIAHRVNGVLQLAGLGMMIAGLTLDRPADPAPQRNADEPSVRPTAWTTTHGAGAGVAGTF